MDLQNETQSVPPPSVPETPTPQYAGSKSRPSIVYIGFILAFLIPLAGLIVSIIARKKTIKESLAGEGLALAGIIVGGIFTTINVVFLGFMIWLIAAFGGFHGNGAQSGSRPITKQLEQIGGKKICSNGDNGYTIDNSKPWYQVYYAVPDSPELTGEVKKIAAEQGYSLHTNTQNIAQLKQDTQDYMPSDEKYNSKTDYLTASQDGRTLTIQINRDASVALRCNSGQYGRVQMAGNGTAIVDISLSLPDTDR